MVWKSIVKNVKLCPLQGKTSHFCITTRLITILLIEFPKYAIWVWSWMVNFHSRRIAQTEYKTNKSNAVLQFVKRQSSKFDTDVKKILYSVLVRSNLEFACPIWSSRHELYKIKIESIQKKMIMFMNGDDKRHMVGNYALPSYIDRYNKFDLGILARRRTNAIALFIHSIITGKYKSKFLRSSISIYDGVRTLRNPEFVWRQPKLITQHMHHLIIHVHIQSCGSLHRPYDFVFWNEEGIT